jgi:hydroxymethylbilane synthase
LAPGQGAPVRKIVLGTRGSDLALAQTRMVESKLREKWQIDVQIEIIRTRGDETIISSETDRAAGRKGIFTAALERALVEKRIDVAVHSAKDLPSALESTLTIDAVLARGMVEDLLLRKDASDTAPMTIATGSVRRQRQARWSNPKAHILPLRGNVPTRLRKFIENDWDAIILARAGLERLGFLPPEFEFEGHKFFAEILPTETFLPAGGQGIIALQTREADFPVRQVISSIDDRDTHLCLRTEREFLRLLQGDCDLPVGVHARFVKGELELRAQVFENEPAPKTAMERGGDPEKLAADVFRQIEQRDG